MTPETSVYSLLKDIYFILEDGDRRLFSQYDLTVPRFYTLKHIGDNPGVSLSRLATLMLSDKGNISRIIKGMEAEGLVVRKPDASDGRALCLYLTAHGDQICRRADEAHRAFINARFSSTDQDYFTIRDQLQQIKQTLREHLERFQSC